MDRESENLPDTEIRHYHHFWPLIFWDCAHPDWHRPPSSSAGSPVCCGRSPVRSHPWPTGLVHVDCPPRTGAPPSCPLSHWLHFGVKFWSIVDCAPFALEHLQRNKIHDEFINKSIQRGTQEFNKTAFVCFMSKSAQKGIHHNRRTLCESILFWGENSSKNQSNFDWNNFRVLTITNKGCTGWVDEVKSNHQDKHPPPSHRPKITTNHFETIHCKQRDKCTEQIGKSRARPNETSAYILPDWFVDFDRVQREPFSIRTTFGACQCFPLAQHGHCHQRRPLSRREGSPSRALKSNRFSLNKKGRKSRIFLYL